MPLFDHFSLLAPIYDRAIPPGERAKFLRLLDARPGSRVLDAGGGTGRVAQRVGAAGADVLVADLDILHPQQLAHLAEQPLQD